MSSQHYGGQSQTRLKGVDKFVSWPDGNKGQELQLVMSSSSDSSSRLYKGAEVGRIRTTSSPHFAAVYPSICLSVYPPVHLPYQTISITILLLECAR